ncbi:hypothetical protein Ae201684P_010804 [Aphanomyces euteiches]|nr:hypothetical protein Ae201684P_010804 [Aphanomyces euteiches]KAH9156391.1 hypothetical protein AeRB84_001673 [Aphanomyces euteiches]
MQWKRIDRWRKDRSNIEKKGTDPSTKCLKTNRAMFSSTTLSKTQEESIATWVHDLRQEGIPISRMFLAAKALEVAAAAGLSSQQFKASNHWVNGFMDRWHLSMRMKGRSGLCSDDDGEAALEKFSNEIQDMIFNKNIVEIYNADQTAVNYEIIPDSTINAKGAKHIWIKSTGHEKDRMTAMLLGDTKGNKYPMFLVLKSPASKIQAVVLENNEKRHGFGVKVWSEVEEL